MKKINILLILLSFPFFIWAQNKGSVSPSGGASGQTLDVTISGKGTHFIPATGTTFVSFHGGGGIIDKTIVNDSLITATVKINKTTTSGTYEIVVSNSTEYASFPFYVDGTNASRLLAVYPSSGNAGQTLDVTITGKNTSFTKNQNYTKFSFNMGTSTITVMNDTMLKANVVIPANTLTGDYDVQVDNAVDGNMNLSHVFHVNSSFLSPYLSEMTPASGYPGQTLDVTITGINTHFAANNNTKLNFGFSSASGTVDVNYLTVLSPTSLRANVTVNKINNVGDAFNGSVTNNDDGGLGLPYKFNITPKPPCTAYFTTVYDSINNIFTLELDSATTTATYFYWDFGDGQTSTAQIPSHSFAKDTLYNVCLRIVTANGDSCEYCHVIGKDSLGNVVRRTKGFNMVVLPSKLVTNVPKENDDFSITAFPNPANEVVTVSTSGLKNTETTTITIYSVEGRLLLQQPLVKDKTDIDVHEFTKGIYLMQIRNNEQSKVIKLVKE